jgi:hypothetical protein
MADYAQSVTKKRAWELLNLATMWLLIAIGVLIGLWLLAIVTGPLPIAG